MEDSNAQSLTKIFKEGLDIYNNVTNSDLPTNLPDMQIDIKKGIKIFEDATRLVSISDIFSRNEGIDEVATNDIQYFLLPALLGSLSLKLTTGERKDIVNVAEIYFKDFLSRCHDYGLSDCQITVNQDAGKSDDSAKEKTEFGRLEEAVNRRAKKIQRFSEQRELKTKLSDLKTHMENEHADEDIKRNYFITMIKLYILEAIDELDSINMEKPILEHMANIKLDEKKPLPKRPPSAPLKPIIITKDEVQKAVFGAGYPSLPTMTVQEFYDKRVADGIFPDPNKKPKGTGSLLEAATAGLSLYDESEDVEREKLEETDADENIARMRAMDEYKDDHRRGWGNRMNRS